MSAGVYLHIPFCKSRCSYCDFATDVYRNPETVERYINALVREIEGFDGYGREADTIYFGGGTPSLLTPSQVEKILSAVNKKFAIAPGAELTMEMNPATVTLETLAGYRTLGINRASFGVQTFDDTELKRLARGHNAQDARDTFRLLRAAGFDNISFDLIAGLPRQTLPDWERNLDEALKLAPEHLSLYLLEIHEGTPLAEQIRSERRPLPDEALAGEMYELMVDRVGEAGYAQYEISNFSLDARESRIIRNTGCSIRCILRRFGHSLTARTATQTSATRQLLNWSKNSARRKLRETTIPPRNSPLGTKNDRRIDLRNRAAIRHRSLTEIRRGSRAPCRSGLIELTPDNLRLTTRECCIPMKVQCFCIGRSSVGTI